MRPGVLGSNAREETWENQLHSLEPLDVLRPTGNAAGSVRKDGNLLIQQTRQTQSWTAEHRFPGRGRPVFKQDRVRLW